MSLSPQTVSSPSLAPAEWVTGSIGGTAAGSVRGTNGKASYDAPLCVVRDLGRLGYADALAVQHELVDRRKRGLIPDTLLFVEHPHVITVGRNAGRAAAMGDSQNLLASPEMLERAGIEFHESDRGGDVTYHGPGQVVGYPIFDLKDWKRDVLAYVRGIEQVLIGALAQFGIPGTAEAGATGVWVNDGAYPAKVAAIGIHVSRWVTSHGFALNLDTDLDYFRYIVPCGLTRPVTSMRRLGSSASRAEVVAALAESFGQVFGRRVTHTDQPIDFSRADRTAHLPYEAGNEPRVPDGPDRD